MTHSTPPRTSDIPFPLVSVFDGPTRVQSGDYGLGARNLTGHSAFRRHFSDTPSEAGGPSGPAYANYGFQEFWGGSYQGLSWQATDGISYTGDVQSDNFYTATPCWCRLDFPLDVVGVKLGLNVTATLSWDYTITGTPDPFWWGVDPTYWITQDWAIPTAARDYVTFEARWRKQDADAGYLPYQYINANFETRPYTEPLAIWDPRAFPSGASGTSSVTSSFAPEWTYGGFGFEPNGPNWQSSLQGSLRRHVLTADETGSNVYFPDFNFPYFPFEILVMAGQVVAGWIELDVAYEFYPVAHTYERTPAGTSYSFAGPDDFLDWRLPNAGIRFDIVPPSEVAGWPTIPASWKVPRTPNFYPAQDRTALALPGGATPRTSLYARSSGVPAPSPTPSPPPSPPPVETHWFGSTTYPSTFGATYHQTVPCAWADPLFPQFIDAQIVRATAGHITLLRATDWLDRLPLNPDNVGLLGGADAIPAGLWNNLDYLFDQTAAAGMLVCLDLSAFRNTLDGHQDLVGLTGYDSANWSTFLPLCVNRYKDRTNLAYWAIGGEPRPPANGGVSTAALTTFYSDISTQIRALAPTNLISCGGLSHINYDAGIDWRAIFALPNIDLVAMHRYSSGDENITMPNVAAWSAANGKPWLLEEFGFTQSLGDATRADDFRRVANAALALGAKAVMYWNLGPQQAPTSYQISPDTNTPLAWAAVQEIGAAIAAL